MYGGLIRCLHLFLYLAFLPAILIYIFFLQISILTVFISQFGHSLVTLTFFELGIKELSR